MVVKPKAAIGHRAISTKWVSPDNRDQPRGTETLRGAIKPPRPDPNHRPRAPAKDIVIEGAAGIHPDNDRTTNPLRTGAQIRPVRSAAGSRTPDGSEAATSRGTLKANQRETSETNPGPAARNSVARNRADPNRADPNRADRSIEMQHASASHSNSGRTVRRRRPTSSR